MNQIEYYLCPVCQKAWDTQEKAIDCRNRHPAIKRRWFECEICGAGWNPDAHWGEKGATDQARSCEQKHHEKGEVEDVSRQIFFMTGGRQGKYIT